MEGRNNKKNFSAKKTAKSFTYAGRGLRIFFSMTHNAWIQVTLFSVAIFLGVYFCITRTEWMMLVFAGGFVLVAEAFNTAIEVDIDLTSPTYHPYARDTKDVAAGAVLLSAITALIIGLIIFVPYILL
jgi:diacylglycerol kinase (ATP)